jgi:hypothetical protein
VNFSVEKLSLLATSVESARNFYHQLVVIAGPAKSGKSTLLRASAKQFGAPVANLNLLLGRAMIDLPERERARQADGLLKDSISAAANGAAIIAIDNIDILFAPGLRLNPLQALKSASRSKCVIVAWPGSHSGSKLSHARPGHPEWFDAPTEGIQVVSLC